MPNWWVSEPYINLWAADEPLSYVTSSGKEMTFRWTYNQRAALAFTPQYFREVESWGYNGFACARMRYSNKQGGGNAFMTNASWQHNWWSEIIFWDPYLETNAVAPTVIDEFGSDPNNPTNAFIPYRSSYQALLLRGDGGTIYFDSSNSNSATAGGQVRVEIINKTNVYGGPNIPHAYQDFYSGLPQYYYPSTGTFFVTNPFTGFKVIFPDGSQDIYGFVMFHSDATSLHFRPGLPPNNPPPRDSTASAYLTQRIDPQGRTSLIGYYCDTNITDTGGGHYVTNTVGYSVKYVVDPDGRTNTYNYDSSDFRQLVSITDPYGRTMQIGADSSCWVGSITDAASNTTTFSYASSNGWINQMVTPYGTTSFSYYQLQETGASNEYEQRAIYASEPLGAAQLYFYNHNGALSVPTSTNAPIVPGQAFDCGTNGTTAHYALNYRDTFHWGRRQFAALSSSVKSSISTLSTALGNLTADDYRKAELKHWMLDPDQISVTETLSCSRDPSPDSAGQIAGAWTFYGNGNNPSALEIDQGSQVTAIARYLSDGTAQYTRYNYSIYSPFVVSDNESSCTLPNGSLGELTNWFQYASTNTVDLLAASNSLGQYTTYGYNAFHQVTAATNALGQALTFTYDSTTHNPLTVSSYTGEQLTFTYYGAVNPATSTNALLKQLEIEPQGAFINTDDYVYGLPKVVHLSGTGLHDSWTTNFWDGLNRLTGAYFQDGSTISNVYSILDLAAHKDHLTNWTYYGFDALQHLTKITNANQNVTTLSWCDCGSLSTITDPLTNTTSLYYDNQARLTNISFPDRSIYYQYDANGRMTNEFDGASRSTQFAYNNQGLTKTISDQFGTLSQIVYDLVGRPIQITDANNITTTNQYDALNRVLKRVWTYDGQSESFAYATNGLTTYTNRNGDRTLFGRDGAGRVTIVTNADSEITSFTYDAAGRVATLTDGASHTTTWNYNAFGWLTNKVDATNHQILLFSYDNNGRVTNRWLPSSGNTQYAYDPLGSITNVIYSNAPTASIRYVYDADSRLQTMVDGIGTHTFDHTGGGRLQSETGPWSSNTIAYGYNQGHRTTLTLLQPSGGAWLQTNYYDEIWRMTNLSSSAGRFVYGYTNSASSVIQSLGLPNSAAIAYQYDALLRLTNTSLANSWGQVLDGYGYDYDLLGQRKNISRYLGITSNNVTIGYDKVGQLISWSANELGGTPRLNEQLGYGYDKAGNLQYRTNGALVQTFAVDTLNQLGTVARTGTFGETGSTPAPANSITINGITAQTYGDFTFARTNLTLVNGNNSFTNIAANLYGVTSTNSVTVNLPTTVSFQYDDNGNLTNDGTRTFLYDAENQLTNVNVPSQWKTEYAFDGLRRKRISRNYVWQGGAWVLTNETRFIYDRALVIQERNSNNVPQVTYTRGLDLSGSSQAAGGIGGLLARTDVSGSAFYHADGAGNVTSLMDGNQNIVARYEYDPYGKLIGKWGPLGDANVYRFSSKEIQTASGLYYYGFRFYEPNLQRWLNPDPLGEEGDINLYRAMYNSPPNYVDPDGRVIFGADEIINAISLVLDAQNFGTDLGGGDYFNAIQDAAATVLDLAGALVPGDPVEGTGIAVQGVRQFERSALEAEKDIAKMEHTLKANKLKKPCPKPKTYQTYTKTHPETKKVYSGRTSGRGTPEQNVADRDAGHHMNDQGYGPAQLDASSSDPAAIRGREQQLIDANGGAQSTGGTSGNTINGIAPSNPNRQTYMNAAKNLK